MEKRQVVIRVDDRVRLMSAVLSATNYPEKSQDRKKHGTHLHARGTRKALTDHLGHPAVKTLQELLDKNIPLASIYTYGLTLSWPQLAGTETPAWVPAQWNEQLKDFYEVTNISKWWADEDSHWQLAVRHLNEAFNKVDMYTFMEPFVGPITEILVFMPNISYPSDQTIGAHANQELITIMPPPMAWGDSPPWPYKDDEALAYRAALAEYGTILMGTYMRQHEDVINKLAEKPLPVSDRYAVVHPEWQDQFMGLFKATITAIFLEDMVSKLEAKSYTQYMQKVENLTILPGSVNVFRRYLDDYKTGKYKSFNEYLPQFPKQLRVVKTIVAL
jgi:hypothetical protein